MRDPALIADLRPARKPTPRRKILVADLLCGAGGSSTGCQRALAELGLEMDLVAVNHWPTAIATHEKNHPTARHYVQDIATVRPHILVPEGYLDLLMASPTCTHHSVARGGKPTSDQQRSDPWHIITWLTELRVKRLIIENVWEFIGWGPVDHRTGKPVASRKGEYFAAWINVIRSLSFQPEWRKLNAADYGDATTRSRFILMARSDRKKLVWPGATHHRRDSVVDLFSGTKPWRPAREIIDWSLKGRSIFDRKKPLAPKTLIRIYAGALKFNWPIPLLVLLRAELERSLSFHLRWTLSVRNAPRSRADRHRRRLLARRLISHLRQARADRRASSPSSTFADPMVVTLRHNGVGSDVGQPIPTVVAGGTHIGLAQPVIVNMKGRSTASSSAEPLPTQTAFAPHLFSAEPIVLSQHNTGAPRGSCDPLPTITTGGAASEERQGCARPMLVEPFVISPRHGREGAGPGPRAVGEPLPTITAGGSQVAVVQPFVLSAAHGVDASEADPHTRRTRSVEDPLGTVHAGGGNFGVVEPFVLSQASCGAPRSVSDPIPTQTTGGNGGTHALIAPYYGSGSGETCTDGDTPLPTVTSKGRFGMVVPVCQSNGGAAARDVGDPLPTMTTAKGGEFAVVMPVTHHDGSNRVRDAGSDPLPTVTGANRGELAFITASFGEREGQAPRVHDLDAPAPTLCATGRVNLVEPTEHYDILFRMLEPHELAAAMGFNTEDARYEFTGTKTEQIKQIGNAVSVSKMKACVAAIMADAAVRRTDEGTTFLEAAE